MSLAERSTTNDESSSIVSSVNKSITGASLTGFTITKKLVLTVKRETESLAVTVTSPEPLALLAKDNVNVVPLTSADN